MRCKFKHPYEHNAKLCAFISQDRNVECPFDTDSFLIIVDTGASAAFTFCKQDFITFTPLMDKVKGLATLKIAGEGTVQYKVKNDQGKTVNLIIENSYYVPEMDICLLSPQQLTGIPPSLEWLSVFHPIWSKKKEEEFEILCNVCLASNR